MERDLIKKGLPIGRIDIMIASICISNGFPLATTDKDFGRIKGLKVISA